VKNIRLELTPFEADVLKYILDRKFLIPKSGVQLSACSRIYAKLLICLKQKGLINT